MEKVYLLWVSNGMEYEDHEEKVICAYYNEQAAQKHADDSNKAVEIEYSDKINDDDWYGVPNYYITSIDIK